MYKEHSNIGPGIMNILEKQEMSYNLWSNAHFTQRHIKSVYHGSETKSHLGPKIWNPVPESMKDSENVNNFISQIKFWKSASCPCRLCKIYLPQKDFISLERSLLQIWL